MVDAVIQKSPIRHSAPAVRFAGDERDSSSGFDLARWLNVVVWGFVAIGVAVRLARYLARFPLWGDEIMLAGGLLSRDFAGLATPLDEHQCAPLLFLWIEAASTRLLGFSEWSLRLFPLICGIAGVFVYRRLASRLLTGLPLAFAVGVFAVAYFPIRHAVELKPYSSDLFVSLVLVTLAVEYHRAPKQARWLCLLALAAPLAIGLSYPAAFVGGGVFLGLFRRVLRQGPWKHRLALALFGLNLMATFIFFYWLASGGQFRSSAEFMRRYWASAFPPVSEPAKLPLWLLLTHTGEMFAYPIGGARGASVATTLCCLIGGITAWKRGQKLFPVMFLSTLGLAFTAGVLQAYPYGSNTRLVLYLAPFICLLAGQGGAELLVRVCKAQDRQRCSLASLAMLAAIGVGILVFDLVHPYKHGVDQVHQGFARWFWTRHAADYDLYCPYSEDGLAFDQNCVPTAYLCYQRVYGPKRFQETRLPPLSKSLSIASEDSVVPTASSGHAETPIRVASAQRPLLAVIYSTTGSIRDERTFESWLANMTRANKLVGQREYSVQLLIPREGRFEGKYEVYEFVRRTDDLGAREALANSPVERK